MNATSLSIETDDLELSPFLVAPTCPSKPWRSWKPGEGGNQRGGLGKGFSWHTQSILHKAFSGRLAPAEASG
jgi:hypothetical protein